MTECRELDQNIADSEDILNSIQSQIHAIEAQYPSGVAPSYIVDQYDNLVDRYNRLRTPHNALVDEYNGKCAR